MEKKKLLKRVLIITYYWVPMGGSGVQRWVKFSKYLPENGWQPVIYTPSNPDFPLRDESFLKDVPECCEIIRQPIWEPYRIASLFSKKKNFFSLNILNIKHFKHIKYFKYDTSKS